MNSKSITTAVVALTLTAATAFAQEKKIQRSELPPAVEKTVQQQSQGATIKGFSTEREHGKKVYEAEMMVDGHSKDIQIATDGTLNEIEEEVAFDSLPANVKSALTARAGSAKITKVESLTKQGKLVAYEAATLNGTKKGEIQVRPRRARNSPTKSSPHPHNPTRRQPPRPITPGGAEDPRFSQPKNRSPLLPTPNRGPASPHPKNCHPERSREDLRLNRHHLHLTSPTRACFLATQRPLPFWLSSFAAGEIPASPHPKTCHPERSRRICVSTATTATTPRDAAPHLTRACSRVTRWP